MKNTVEHCTFVGLVSAVEAEVDKEKLVLCLLLKQKLTNKVGLVSAVEAEVDKQIL